MPVLVTYSEAAETGNAGDAGNAGDVGIAGVELPAPDMVAIPWKAAKAATPSFMALLVHEPAARWRISGLAR